MTEKQQDLGKRKEEKKLPLGEAIQDVVNQICIHSIEETLNKGKMIFIPSLGLVITPDRQAKNVSELTEEELKANPHVYDPSRNTGDKA